MHSASAASAMYAMLINANLRKEDAGTVALIAPHKSRSSHSRICVECRNACSIWKQYAACALTRDLPQARAPAQPQSQRTRGRRRAQHTTYARLTLIRVWVHTSACARARSLCMPVTPVTHANANARAARTTAVEANFVENGAIGIQSTDRRPIIDLLSS